MNCVNCKHCKDFTCMKDGKNVNSNYSCEFFQSISNENISATSEKMTVQQSIYRKNIIEKLDKQIQKGIDKYGTTLEQNQWFTAMDRLTYLQEELIDGLVYTEHIMAKLKELNIELD